MSSLYDVYVRFMVWLGAEPPPGYGHLLQVAKTAVAPKSPPVKPVAAKTAPKPAPQRSPQPSPPRPVVTPSPPQNKAQVDALYRLLKGRVLGNEATVKRLVDAERKRNPGGNLEVWLQAANDRWEHDNRW